MNRQYRDHEQWSKRYNDRHDRWWDLGQQQLQFEAWARSQGIDPSDKEAIAAMQDEMPF